MKKRVFWLVLIFLIPFVLSANPVIDKVILNSTTGGNFTSDNLICYVNATDAVHCYLKGW